MKQCGLIFALHSWAILQHQKNKKEYGFPRLKWWILNCKKVTVGPTGRNERKYNDKAASLESKV